MIDQLQKVRLYEFNICITEVLTLRSQLPNSVNDSFQNIYYSNGLSALHPIQSSTSKIIHTLQCACKFTTTYIHHQTCFPIHLPHLTSPHRATPHHTTSHPIPSHPITNLIRPALMTPDPFYIIQSKQKSMPEDELG